MLSTYFSDSTQVIIFHRLMTLYMRGGGGKLNKSMGRGVAGLRTVNYHEKRPAYFAPLVERKIDQEAALVIRKSFW